MDTKLQQLFQLLRWCGAAMIVAAAGTFLVQGWDQVDDVQRYLALLGTTVLLPALAYVCGIRMQEGRSARVLMITLLTLLPVHAGVLGGFVFSQFGSPADAIAPIAQWVAPSPTVALLLVAAAGAALLPLVWGAYRVLSRPHASLLTAISAGSHALLLIPNRSPLGAMLFLVPMLTVAAWCAMRVKPQTREAQLALWSLTAPAWVMTARQVLLYDVTAAFWGTILGTAALVLLVFGRKSRDVTVERFALIPTMLSVGAFMVESKIYFSDSTAWLLYGVLTALPLLAFAATSERCKAFFVKSAVILNATTATTTLLVAPRPWAALQAIAVGLGLLSYGHIGQRRGALYAGIGLAGFGFIVEVAHAIDVFEPSGWPALAGFGLGLVALTAWLERRARGVREIGEAAQAPANVSPSLPEPLPR